jgi:hypothetical protein
MVIYRHIRLDTNQVFYIGIGKDSKRPYSKSGRSVWWHNIKNKTEIEVQILKTDLSFEDACELEQLLISHYGRKDLGTGNLVNLNEGGNGQIGFKHSEESKNKMSESGKGKIPWNKGLKNPQPITEETRKKLSIALKGVGNKKVIDEVTGEIYESLTDCANKNNISKKLLSRYLTGDRKNKTNFKYV